MFCKSRCVFHVGMIIQRNESFLIVAVGRCAVCRYEKLRDTECPCHIRDNVYYCATVEEWRNTTLCVVIQG